MAAVTERYKRHTLLRFCLLAALLVCALSRDALGKSAVSVAAAANLVYALESLNTEFKRLHPDVTLTTATGASGSLFAQIKNGAPFDVFLSADTDYPRELIQQNLGDPASLRIFATGRLVLWTTRESLDIADPGAVARNASVKKLALAQPRTAPYGRAAQAALEKLGAWTAIQPRLVVGENITQTAQFVETGNADAGFVAMSIVLSPRLAGKGRWSEVSPELYASVPLDHVAVLTLRGAKNSDAQRYLDFLGSEPARKILREFGYGVK